MNRDLQTKLAHERMAHEEATRHAEARLREVEEVPARRTGAAPAGRGRARRGAGQVRQAARTSPSQRASATAAWPPPKPRLEPDQPDSPYVEWWVPGWKDKFRRGSTSDRTLPG